MLHRQRSTVGGKKADEMAKGGVSKGDGGIRGQTDGDEKMWERENRWTDAHDPVKCIDNGRKSVNGHRLRLLSYRC